ncbi:MAG: TolB family protein [Polyangiales bacterium]
MRHQGHLPRAVAVLALLAPIAGCTPDPPTTSQPYFDTVISPILQHSCSRQTTGCHTADPNGNSVGNLDTTSFDAINARHDLLVTYGPYDAPGLLLKVAGPQTLTASTLDASTSFTTDIRHAGGFGIDVTSEAYATLRRWMDNGATQDNSGVPPGPTPTGACTTNIPADPAFDPAADPGPNYQLFHDTVQPVLAKRCSASSCHGNAVADLQLTCGTDDTQVRWNAFIASQYLSATAAASELVRRPLDPARGGVFHEGGIIFSDPSDPDYQALVTWATAQGQATLPADLDNDGFKFFANRVQPTLVRKGCMFLGCHSAQMFHDLRLRGGSGGAFSIVASRLNYEMSRKMLALESPNPNDSRLVAKNVFPYDPSIDPAATGVRHRGGPLLEDVSGVAHATAGACASFAGDPIEKGDISAVPGYCIVAAWIAKERAAAVLAGAIADSPLKAIAYVSRLPNQNVPQDFWKYQPGAQLHLATASISAAGAVSIVSDSDVTSACGLNAATADIRRPAASWDATEIAFAARSSSGEPYSIFRIKSNGSGCARDTTISPTDPSLRTVNGILVHDFDPAYSPDGRLVFASTRGAINDDTSRDYSGPTLTPAGLIPNANVYVLEGTAVRELTFLLNQEFEPSFMRDGRVIMTAEKRSKDFYQLAGRRINLDGGDYHPLYASRKSIGFEQLTEVRELADRNFIGVFSDKGALAQGGTIGVINRSIGPDQSDRDPNDRFFLHSLTLPDPQVTAKPGVSKGLYRSPAPLPAQSFLASFADGCAVDSCSGEYALVQVDEHTGARTTLVQVSGRAIVEAVAVYARTNLGTYTSSGSEPNGAVQIDPTTTNAHIENLDMPMLGSLLTTNTRIGRQLETRMTTLGVLESEPPPSGSTDFTSLDPSSVVTDSYGPQWLSQKEIARFPLLGDGSVIIDAKGGLPYSLELIDGGGVYLTQKEEIQLYPGEHGHTSFPRAFFGAVCGGCHGSISGREVDVHLVPDLLTAASHVQATAK